MAAKWFNSLDTNSTEVPCFLNIADKWSLEYSVCLKEQAVGIRKYGDWIGWGPFVQGDQIWWGQFVQGDQLYGDILSRGTGSGGPEVWGSNWFGTKCVAARVVEPRVRGCHLETPIFGTDRSKTFFLNWLSNTTHPTKYFYLLPCLQSHLKIEMRLHKEFNPILLLDVRKWLKSCLWIKEKLSFSVHYFWHAKRTILFTQFTNHSYMT